MLRVKMSGNVHDVIPAAMEKSTALSSIYNSVKQLVSSLKMYSNDGPPMQTKLWQETVSLLTHLPLVHLYGGGDSINKTASKCSVFILIETVDRRVCAVTAKCI